MSETIGFIGLGALGRTVAVRLAGAGHPLLLWNRTPGKAEGLGEMASCPAEVVTRTRTVVLCLRDSEAVWAVTSGPSGIFAGETQGRTIIDLSTNHVELACVLHGLATKGRAAYLEAPVLGSVVPASRGELTVLVSGEEAPFAAARPLLEVVGKRIFFLGEPGLATKMKLANNLVLATILAGLADATALAEAAGIPREQALEILGAGAGSGAVLAAKREKLLREDYAPHFSAALLYKDLHYLQDLARTLRRPLFTAALVKELFALAFPRGLAERDVSVIFPILREGILPPQP
ncbi:MAG TPA: NAD(P)-dependent oxidoreductase [Candidatus Methanoperedens sp.]|nr:NAD(P)-dependent oxidoreductase [Candidatus Methanoperedens sp.]